MKKLKLNLEDLKVESFETSSKSINKGTVHGNGDTVVDRTCEEYHTCGGQNSCDPTNCPGCHVTNYTQCGTCPTDNPTCDDNTCWVDCTACTVGNIYSCP